LQSSVDQHWSTIYDQGRDFTLAKSQEITRFLSYADSSAPKTVLDIGSGTGQLTRELFHRGLPMPWHRCLIQRIKNATNLTTVSADWLRYLHFDIEDDDINKLPDQPYGLVTCRLVYAFIGERKAFLERIAKLLAPNGLFVVITPLPEDVPAEKSAIAVKPDDMNLLSQYFEEVVSYRELGLTYFIGKLSNGG
jgi:2-polyprenyl-3-methyl-5-hydroxy-6-metoxy-1,4-benzoquinol methylase